MCSGTAKDLKKLHCLKRTFDLLRPGQLFQGATFIKNYYKIDIEYSDHNMICVDLKVTIPKSQENYITARDFRKLRSNP